MQVTLDKQVYVTDCEIPALDGYPLAATLFAPEDADGCADCVVIINSAMAVKRGYYAKYAHYLAEHGFTVVTYDYRGIGDSCPKSLRGFKATLNEWGRCDAAGVVNWVTVEQPQARLLVVGHSVGGQILGLMPNYTAVGALFGVAAQSGYWRNWSGMGQMGMFLFWHTLLPVSTRLFGYYPGRIMQMGENVPAGVALEWARAGRQPNYLYDVHVGTSHHHYDEVTISIQLYSFADDSYAPRQAVDNLRKMYPNADVNHMHIDPQDIGASSLGHFGFFRQQFKDTLWTRSLDWLLAHKTG